MHHLPTKTIAPVDWDAVLMDMLEPSRGVEHREPSPSSEDTTPPPPARSSVALHLVVDSRARNGSAYQVTSTCA